MGWDEEYVKAKAPDLILQAAPTFDERNLDTALVNGKWNSKVWIEA